MPVKKTEDEEDNSIFKSEEAYRKLKNISSSRKLIGGIIAIIVVAVLIILILDLVSKM